jgi:viroplasmin and RNaseH domain-containing protein
MSKFYAVKIGRIPGIYNSWVECEKNVKGFSGAIYKSFTKREDAESFLTINIPTQNPQIIQNTTKNNIEVFTDGSHSKHEKNGYLGFGAFCSYMEKEYIFSGNCTKELLYGYDIDPNTKVSNPTMEFLGFAEFLRMMYEAKKDLSNYTFIFKIDYEGVGFWMNNIWKTKEIYIRKIKEKCDFFIKNINAKILIEHVPGHSNIYGNERADQLAKSHIPINTFPKLFEIL